MKPVKPTPKPPKPPKWAKSFLRWFCKPELLEHIEGDLEESFESHLEQHNLLKPKKQLRKAQWQYVIEVFMLCRPRIFRVPSFFSGFNLNISIFQSYVKIAFRQIARQKLFSAINLVGLSISMSVSLLIIIMLHDQFSYDEFHVNKECIFRVTSDRQSAGSARPMNTATAPLPIANELDSLFPGVEKAVRIVNANIEVSSKQENLALKGKFVDPAFLAAFSFAWGEGDREQALRDPTSLVITASTAEKIFGLTNPINQIISIPSWGEYIVKGIIQDPPRRSHIQFDFLLPLSALQKLERGEKYPQITQNWENIWSGYVYVWINERFDQSYLDQALHQIAAKQNEEEPEIEVIYKAQPLLSIVPGIINNNEMDAMLPAYILWFLGGLGLIIMVLACVNYTNLSIAKSLKRAKEIGIRKVIGAKRNDLLIQFIFESVLLSLLSLGMAIVLLEYLIPAFLVLEPELSNVFHLKRDPTIYGYFFIFSLIIGVLTGFFPAWHLSAFDPASSLKNLKNIKPFSFLGLRKLLIVGQFTFSLLFILSTLIILRQYKKVYTTDLGFQTDNIVHVELEGVEFELLANRLNQLKEVKGVSGSFIIPGAGNTVGNCISYQKADSVSVVNLDFNWVDPHFIDNLGINLVAGENFPKDVSKEQEQFILLSETAIHQLGFLRPQEAVGEIVALNSCEQFDSSRMVIIRGVIQDIYYKGIIPFAEKKAYGLRYDPEHFTYANIQLIPGDQHVQAFLPTLKDIWSELSPNIGLKYTFYNEKLENQYKVLNIASSIIGFIGILSIVISCMGLLGMVVYQTEGRLKEVGIRKVLGTNVQQLVWLLSRSFLGLLLVAVVVAVPLIWKLNMMWLELYPVRISLGIELFMLGIFIMAILAGTAIISQTVRAAHMNPIDILRDE